MPSLDDLLEMQGKNAHLDDNPNVIMVGFDLTREWITSDGQRFITQDSHENSMSWQRLGYAMESIIREIGMDTAFRLATLLESDEVGDEEEVEDE